MSIDYFEDSIGSTLGIDTQSNKLKVIDAYNVSSESFKYDMDELKEKLVNEIVKYEKKNQAKVLKLIEEKEVYNISSGRVKRQAPEEKTISQSIFDIYRTSPGSLTVLVYFDLDDNKFKIRYRNKFVIYELSFLLVTQGKIRKYNLEEGKILEKLGFDYRTKLTYLK